MVINVNIQATVTLTNAGRRRLVEFIKDLLIGDPESHCDVCYRGWRDGKMTTSLWELMQIFGKMMYNGCPAVPFESNEIEFPDETEMLHSRERTVSQPTKDSQEERQ